MKKSNIQYKDHLCSVMFVIGIVAPPQTCVGEVQLAWDDNSVDEAGFKIERRTAGLSWELVATLPANSTTYTDDSAMAGVEYEYKVHAYNNTGGLSYSNIANGVSLISYVNWLTQYFSSSDLDDPRVTGDDKDPDRDGFSNLVEYAFNTDPSLNNATPISVLMNTGYGDNRLGLVFTRLTYANDINYIVQASSDLSAWSEIARSEAGADFSGTAVITESGDIVRTTTVTDISPADSMSRFMRIQIEK